MELEGEVEDEVEVEEEWKSLRLEEGRDPRRAFLWELMRERRAMGSWRISVRGDGESVISRT